MADENYGLRLDLDDANYTARAQRAATATVQLDTSMARIASGGGGARIGMALNAAAQGFEDLQYGVAGAMNNLSQMAIMMGAGGMVVAGVTIAGVAINQLVKHWEDLQSVLGMGGGGFKPVIGDLQQLEIELNKVDKRIGELTSKKTIDFVENDELQKLIGEQATLRESQARKKGISAIESTGTAMDAERASGVKEAIATVGGSHFVGQAQEALERSGKTSEEAQRLILDATKGEKYAIDTLIESLNAINSDLADVIASNMPEAIADWERTVAEATESGQALSKQLDARRNSEAKAAKEAERAAEKQATEEKRRREEENDRAKRWLAMSPTERRLAGTEDMTYEGRIGFLKGAASDAMKRYNEAEFAYATAGNPQMARMMRQQQAMAQRFGGANTSASIMQRQMIERMGGGADAIAQRERAQEVMREASMTFKEAVEKLAREGLQVTL